ncbi:MAG: nicotinate-nucleotide adenylyltransferase [Thermodesulfovibrionia bacterium]
MKIGIYGGAFNPIHYGHLRTAEEILELLCLDNVLFIPSGRPPFDKPELEDAAHRYNMVKMAINGNPYFKLSDIEMRTRGRAYSVDTLKRLRREFKRDEFFFIMGIDAFLDLPKWKEPEILITMTNLVIMSRPHFKFTDLISSPYLEGVSKGTLRRLEKGAIPILSIPISERHKAFLSRVTEINISASHIRELIKDGRSIRYLLPEVVESYIISHRLYRNIEPKRGR